MSKQFELKLNIAGLVELRRGPEVRSLLETTATAVERTAGDGYKHEVLDRPSRAIAKVSAATPHAYYSNKKHNTLIKALGANSQC